MKRVLLKISGEALSSSEKSIDPNQVQALAQMIIKIKKSWVELVLVLGWGNIYRGSKLIESGVDATDSHNMSMLSTVFNAVSLKNFLVQRGEQVIVMDALGVEFLEKYTASQAKQYLEKWNIVICTSGTGSPFFTTDTGGVLRALETHCDAMIKLTKVDGVYDMDPMKHKNAKKFESLSYDDCIRENLKILDQTGIIMARDNSLPLFVTKLDDLESILDILSGRSSGTKIH